LSDVESLSRLDKIRLIQFLAKELERGESGLIELVPQLGNGVS